MSRREHQRLADVLVAIAGMRDHLAHRYFDLTHDILQATVDHDLPQLEAAVERLLAAAPPDTDR